MSLATMAVWLLTACREHPSEPATEPDAPAVRADPDRALRDRALAVFAPLPHEAPSATNPVTDAKVELGKALYYDPRLSVSQDISCNSCHPLEQFGAEAAPVSSGVGGQKGERNAPTVYNAALHVAQFWDGRAPDVEAQAKGPMTNPVEMAMGDAAHVEAVVRSIPGYAPMFQQAFPGEPEPVTFENTARAIAAFERRLLTPSRFDAWLGGTDDALTAGEKQGLATFIDVGCPACHNGSTVGGLSFQKLGAARPYPTKDVGREGVTGEKSDENVFKTPSLRNVTATAPYFHDGSIGSVDDAVRTMADVQLGRQLTKEEVAAIRTFLGSLTGEVDAKAIAAPPLPPSGPQTPKPGPAPSPAG